MFFRSDITKGLSEYRHTEGALLIDVREKDMFPCTGKTVDMFPETILRTGGQWICS